MRYFEVKKPRIEIVPMIDIMLFLLVFFIMMAMKMIPASGLIGHLPSSTTAQDLPQTKILIEIKSDGGLLVDQAPMSLDNLPARLQSASGENTVVTVAGDAGVKLQQLTQVMDICRHSGITKIGLATQNAN
ncbi:MAG TPA: biopolymer transporter ExbD [Rhodocyclaceae bacterium]|jgi:biopolymer transport protein ExbD|nr:biopolymer transporter ExbD [Rhodocyclaceae bacterium]